VVTRFNLAEMISWQLLHVAVHTYCWKTKEAMPTLIQKVEPNNYRICCTVPCHAGLCQMLVIAMLLVCHLT